MSALDKIKQNIAKEVNKALAPLNTKVSGVKSIGRGKKLVQVPTPKVVGTSDLISPPNPEFGDLSLPLFDVSKKFNKTPVETASWLVGKVETNDILSSVKVIGPYLNFILNKNYLAKEVINEIGKGKEKYGKSEELKGKRIMVEFAHPNPFKAFHIGHLRNILLGESICRILESQGAKIIRVNYQGDVGMHIAKCIWAFKEVDKKDYPKDVDARVALIGKCYAKGAKAFEDDNVAKGMIKLINKKIYLKDDKEINKLWELGKKWSLDKFYEIYKRVDSRFEREYMESEMIDDSKKIIKKAQKKGILKESDGAIIFDGSSYGLDTRVFLNSEGLPTYEGKELALAYKEFSDFGKIDLCIHNVAVEQISFFKVTFKVEELLDEKKFKGRQYHNAYEFVGLKKGKMSSRKGEVVLGNDIMDEGVEKIKKIIKSKKSDKDINNISESVGVGAIKYAFLKISPFKYLAFDMDESVSFNGNSGPYLQYTYARIQSIVRKSKVQSLKSKDLKFTENKESELVMKLAKYPEIVIKAGEKYDPSEIAKYLFELASQFNDYYHSVPVLKAEKEIMEARLALINAVAQIIKNGLGLLGIDVADEM